KAADRAGAVVRELLAYSAQLALETSQVQLNELIEDMQPALEQMLGRDIQLVPDLSRDVAPVLADPAQVRQIVLKLAANSREAMEQGGKFRIGTRNAPADDPALARKGESGSYAVLEVGDLGPGLDDQSWEHLYDPFFTTKQHGKRGLGLAAVHGIVRHWAAACGRTVSRERGPPSAFICHGRGRNPWPCRLNGRTAAAPQRFCRWSGTTAC